MVTVGAIRCRTLAHSKAGRAKPGSACGIPPKREPMVSTGNSKLTATMVAMASAMMVPGMRPKNAKPVPGMAAVSGLAVPGLFRCSMEVSRGQIRMTASDARPSAIVVQLRVSRFRLMIMTCEMKSAGILSMDRPRKSLTCDMAMVMAMPLVNPITMAIGMKRMNEPMPVNPMTNSSTPAIMVEMYRLARP